MLVVLDMVFQHFQSILSGCIGMTDRQADNRYNARYATYAPLLSLYLSHAATHSYAAMSLQWYSQWRAYRWPLGLPSCAGTPVRRWNNRLAVSVHPRNRGVPLYRETTLSVLVSQFSSYLNCQFHRSLQSKNNNRKSKRSYSTLFCRFCLIGCKSITFSVIMQAF